MPPLLEDLVISPPRAFHGTGQLFRKMAVWMAPIVGVLLPVITPCTPAVGVLRPVITPCALLMWGLEVTQGLFDSFCFLSHAPYASTYILQGCQSLRCMESVSAFLWPSLDRQRDCCVLTCPVCCPLSLGLCGMGSGNHFIQESFLVPHLPVSTRGAVSVSPSPGPFCLPSQALVLLRH